MKKTITATFWFVSLLLLLVGCSGEPDVQPLIFNAAPWQPNEVSTYDLTDLNENAAGKARFDLTELADGGWNLRREINSHAMQEIVVVDMSEEGFRPAESTLIRIDPNGTEVVRSVYSGSQADLELTTKQNITTQQRVSIPSDSRNNLPWSCSCAPSLLPKAFATRLNVFLPVVGTLDRVTVQVVEQEQITVPAGTFDTWHVLMETPNSKTDVWISTEAPYPVVKFIDSRNGGTFELSAFDPDGE